VHRSCAKQPVGAINFAGPLRPHVSFEDTSSGAAI
jgi:hypothetical protein